MTEDRHHHDGTARDHDALTRLLRDADPAADGAGLDAVERAHMRQTITEAADGHAGDGLWPAAWQGWGRPVLVAAAAITVVGLALWALDRNPEAPSSEIADAGVTAPEAPNPVPDPGETPQLVTALDPATDPAAPEVEPAATPSPDAAPAATPVSPPENTAVAAVNDSSPLDRQARTVQFTAPRGTRIIWTLDPNFESPIAERETRQEQAQ